jgi:hypothetical protein
MVWEDLMGFGVSEIRRTGEKSGKHIYHKRDSTAAHSWV